MGDFAKLLEPISTDQPVGVNLYYEKEFDQIKDARRADDTAPKGLWEQKEAKVADYKLVSRLISDALTHKTKDLRLGVWLAEAWIYCEGAPGIVSGIQFLQALLQNFWDEMYPKIEDGDTEDRAAPLEWFGSYFDPTKGSSPKLAICRLPLVKGKYDFFVYQESRKVGYEADVKDSETRKKTRAALIAEGKISAEAFDKVFDETPKAFYKQLDAEYKLALEALNQFDSFCREKFTKNPPSFGTLRKTLEEVANAVQILLSRRLKTDPDPIEPAAAEETAETAEADNAAQSAGAPAMRAATIDLSQFGGGAIKSADQAGLHILAAAQYLRQQ